MPEDLPGIVCGYHLSIARAKPGVCGAFLKFIFDSHEVRAQAEVACNGLTRVGLSQAAIDNLLVPVPPLTEQEQIVRLIRHHLSNIDALIAEQRRLVVLLKEKREGVITHAVTKGLNLDARTKYSGREWIGPVPENWFVARLKADLSFLTSGSRGWAEHYADAGDIFLRITNLRRGDIRLDLDDLQFVIVPPGSEGERTRVKHGDLLFSITAYLGSVAVVPDDLPKAFVSQHIALARLKGDLLTPEWAAFVAISDVGQTYFEMQGYGGAKVQLSLDDVRGLQIVIPPINEQRKVDPCVKTNLVRQ